ncbi:hypothetical protein S83_051364, partial [Arachis hypogaea]
LQAFNHAAITSPPHPEQCATHPVHRRLNIEVASSSLLAPGLPLLCSTLVAPSLQVQGPAVQVRKTDPAWGHCKQVLDKGKSTLVCIYCEKLIRGGGINRVKHHLAGKGGDIEACRKVPAAVRHQFSQNIEDLRTKKRKTQEEYAESYGACDDVEREFDEIEHQWWESYGCGAPNLQ